MPEPTPIPEVAPTNAAPAATPEPIIKPETTEPSPGDVLKAPPDAKKPEAELKYEFKAPEGYDVKGLEAFAKELKMAPDVAQKVLERELATKETWAKAQEAEYKNLVEKVWPAEIYNDPVLGGANIDKTRLTVMKAWQELPQGLRKEMSDLGLHVNPYLVKVLNHFGQLTKEDRIAGPPASQPAPKARPSLEAEFAQIHKQNQ